MNKIIQCPSCSTKFALSMNQLEGLDNPKFHCSRCNTVFSINKKEDTSELKLDKSNDLNKSSSSSTTDSDLVPEKTTLENEEQTEVEDEWTFGESRSEDEDLEDPHFSVRKEDEGEDENDRYATPHINDEQELLIQNEVNSENFKSISESVPNPSIDDKSTDEDKSIDSSVTEISPTSFSINSSLDFDTSPDSSKISKEQLPLQFSNRSTKSESTNAQGRFSSTERMIRGGSSFDEEDENIKISWDSNDPSTPYEADLSKISKPTQGLDDISQTEDRLSVLTRLLSEDRGVKPSSQETRADAKLEDHAKKFLSDSPLKTSSLSTDKPQGGFGLSGLKEVQDALKKFEDDKLKNKTEHSNPLKSEIQEDQKEEPLRNPTLSNKELILSNTDSTSAIKDVPIREIQPQVPIADNSTSSINRSMKDTTVIKRDEMDLQGFAEPEDDEFENFTPSSEKVPFNSSLIVKDESIFQKGVNALRNTRKINSPQTPIDGDGPAPLLRHIAAPQVHLPYFFSFALIAWSVPAILVICFAFWGRYLSNTPIESMDKESIGFSIISTLGITSPLKVSLPPEGVILYQLSSHPMMSHVDKEYHLTIMGKVSNATEEIVTNLTIDTFFFDESNKLVSKVRGKAPNLLGKQNIRTMTFDQIKKLQQEAPPDQFILPNESINFQISTNENLDDIKWFSARIFSANEI